MTNQGLWVAWTGLGASEKATQEENQADTNIDHREQDQEDGASPG